MEDLFVIYWQAPTGVVGYGSAISRQVADAWLARMKREHPEMRHWTIKEQRPDTDKAV